MSRPRPGVHSKGLPGEITPVPTPRRPRAACSYPAGAARNYSRCIGPTGSLASPADKDENGAQTPKASGSDRAKLCGEMPDAGDIQTSDYGRVLWIAARLEAPVRRP